MCNACGFQCCGYDGFSGCGCDSCDEPECWSDDALDDFEDDEGFILIDEEAAARQTTLVHFTERQPA